MSETWLEDEVAAVLDRSTLDRWSTCPLQAALVEQGYGKSAGAIAAAGSEVHAALGRVVTLYVESGGNMRREELLQAIERELLGARPDVQSDALRGFKASMFSWSRFISTLNPMSILRYDGGTGQYSGQVARDLQSGDRLLRLTAEVDLLLGTDSPVVVEDVDYKSGHKVYTEAMARDGFQPQFHWWLLTEHYPNVECMRFRYWNTRSNTLTYRVEFDRYDLEKIEARIRSAVFQWERVHVAGLKPEAWPFTEKCEICSVASLCPHVDVELKDFDPAAAVDWLAASEARSAALRKRLAKHVDQDGEIVTAAGNAFGRERPKQQRKANAELYSVTTKGTDDADHDSGQRAPSASDQA